MKSLYHTLDAHSWYIAVHERVNIITFKEDIIHLIWLGNNYTLTTIIKQQAKEIINKNYETNAS